MIENVHPIETKDRENQGHIDETQLKLEAKDRLAIVLAVWRTILPWGLLILLIYFLVFLLFDGMF